MALDSILYMHEYYGHALNLKNDTFKCLKLKEFVWELQ